MDDVTQLSLFIPGMTRLTPRLSCFRYRSAAKEDIGCLRFKRVQGEQRHNKSREKTRKMGAEGRLGENGIQGPRMIDWTKVDLTGLAELPPSQIGMANGKQ